MNKRGVLWCALALVVACKSEEQKRQEEAKAQVVVAAQKMAEAAKNLGIEGANAGLQGAASGMQGAAAGMQNAAAAMQKMAEAMQAKGGGAELVNFRELKALLPETLAGMKRTEASGEKAGFGGMVMAFGKARYKGEGGARLDLKMMDVGGMAAPMVLGTLGLASVEIDKETENGYEKTGTFDGHKSFEKFNKSSKRSELKLLIGSRFIVEVDGHEVSMDDLKAAVKSIDLAKLEALGAKK